MKKALSLNVLNNLRPSEKEYFVWDFSMAGFGVRVKPNGSVSFVVQYKTADGRTRRQSLGTYGRKGHPAFKQARDAADALLSKAKLGMDPIGQARSKRDALTIADLCREYLVEAEAGRVLNRSGRPKATSTLKTDRGRICQHILPLIGRKRVEELSRQDVTRFIRDVEMGKTARNVASGNLRGRTVVTGGAGTARRTVGLLSGIMSYAVKQGYLETNPVHGVERGSDRRRTIGEVPILYAALGRALRQAEERGEDWRALMLIRLIAMTGMRRGEAVRLKWEHVRRSSGTLVLEDSKTGLSVRPFPRAAIELLNELPNAWTSGFVFPAPRSEGAAYGGLPNAWTRISRASEIEPEDRDVLASVTLHHLRHAAASTAHELGMSLPTIGAILGHASGGVTAGYVHHVDHALRAAADRLGGSVSQAIDGKQTSGAKIVRLQ